MSSVARSAADQAAPVSVKPSEMRKLILKLRWIGMDEEAERLSVTLAHCAPAECPLMDPRDTD